MICTYMIYTYTYIHSKDTDIFMHMQMEKKLEQTYRQDAIDEEHRKERLAGEEKQESAQSIANRYTYIHTLSPTGIHTYVHTYIHTYTCI